MTAQGRAQTPSAATDLRGYVADLQNWSEAVAQLPAHPEKSSELRHSVPLKLELQDGGQHYTVSNTWLVLALVHFENDAHQRAAIQQQIAQRLQWELQQAQALNQPEEAPSSRVGRAQLAAVLSRREFRFVRPPSWWDLMWARVWRWIGRQLEKLMGRLHLKPAVSNVLSWILLSVAFLLLALILWRNLRRASRGMTRLGLQAPASTAWGWRQWADAAQAALAGQRYREAVHCCYWAAVFRLEQMGVWRLDDSRTPREYVRLLPRDSQHRQTMTSLTRSFEMAWYGYRPVTPEQAESTLRELENLECNSPSIAATASY
ncbi:MAG TPA: DUF4129 domain-containing protein [Terriglobales bacterium]|nr:DUF4129 domain-containing protein [Terriglobales bacterium]